MVNENLAREFPPLDLGSATLSHALPRRPISDQTAKAPFTCQELASDERRPIPAMNVLHRRGLPTDIREAGRADCDAMSEVLEELIAAGQRVKRGDALFALSHYIQHPHRLHCLVAIDGAGKLLGFQSLKLAHDGNPYGTPAGWGIIGTHVRPSAVRAGVGSRLFASTLHAAQRDGLPAIEAYIDERNSAALAYYDAVGFQTCRRPTGIICKCLRLEVTGGE